MEKKTVGYTVRLTKELLDALRKLATREERSLNGQIVYLLNRAVENSDEQS